MRIIAGLAKGRNINSPISQVRPTSDRAREALFSTLESEFGSLSDANFLDLYAGSGAVSCEALSRGAGVVVAVDNEEKATTVTRSNFELLEKIPGIGSASVITMSAGKYLDKGADIVFDIVFIDPPYDLPNSDVEKILLSLASNGFLKSSSIVAVERDSKTKPFSWPQGLAELKVRKYGAASIYYGEPRQ